MGTFTRELAGKQWRQKIRESVRTANWFILLLPNPSDELDWCLFETGLFEAQLTSADRLICLHHPDIEIPNPIEGYQGVAATRPEMEKFLRMALVEANPVAGMLPLNPYADKRVPELAARIVDAIRAPKLKIHQKVFVPAVNLRLEGGAALKGVEDLDAAMVVSANDEGLEIFGYEQFAGTFGELRSGIVEEHGDSRWRDELFHVIRKIAQGKTFRPVQAVLSSPNGKVYRPVAYAVERSGKSGPITSYGLTFAEDVGTADMAHMPAELANLATLLRYAFRFRWEVLERFSRGALKDEDIERLDISLTRILEDWESRGAHFEQGVPELFKGKQAARVREMTLHWHRLHNKEKTGELDMAIFEKDGRKVPELLASVLPMNQEFLEMAAARFAEMIANAKKRM